MEHHSVPFVSIVINIKLSQLSHMQITNICKYTWGLALGPIRKKNCSGQACLPVWKTKLIQHLRYFPCWGKRGKSSSYNNPTHMQNLPSITLGSSPSVASGLSKHSALLCYSVVHSENTCQAKAQSIIFHQMQAVKHSNILNITANSENILTNQSAIYNLSWNARNKSYKDFKYQLYQHLK